MVWDRRRFAQNRWVWKTEKEFDMDFTRTQQRKLVYYDKYTQVCFTQTFQVDLLLITMVAGYLGHIGSEIVVVQPVLLFANKAVQLETHGAWFVRSVLLSL